jgi:hypothetical protein
MLEDFDVENPKEETEEDTTEAWPVATVDDDDKKVPVDTEQGVLQTEKTNQSSVNVTTEAITTTSTEATSMKATNTNTTTAEEAENSPDTVAVTVNSSDEPIPDHQEKRDTLKDLESGMASSFTETSRHNAIFPTPSGTNSREDPNAETNDDNLDDGIDEISDSGTSDGGFMDIHSFDGDQDGTISLPVAGECRADALPQSIRGNTRTEPNGCAICLGHFEVGDKVSWSSNPSCQHVFHDDCIKDWLMASGRKHLKRQRREQRRTGNLSYTSDPVAKITGFPMLCPCCRQAFIMPDEEDSEDEKAPSPEVGNTEAMVIASS